MRIAALLATALGLVALPVHAADGPLGRPCAFYEMNGAEIPESTWESGFLYGGPYAGGGTLACTIQTAGSGTHADPDLAVASATGDHAVAVPPTWVSVDVLEHGTYFVCTQFTPAGGATLYWDAVASGWTADAAAPCRSSRTEATDPLLPVWYAVDGAICGPLSALAPPDGDVYVGDDAVWDCPPYTS
jgi:hypothetical protein